MKIELPHRFTPREYQKEVLGAIIEDKVKRAVCCWHRRAGKDKTFLNIMITKAMQKMGNYAYYFPTATLGRKALWDNIDANSGMRVIDHIPSPLVRKMNEQQMKITLVNGSTIQILGTETLDVVGGNPVGVNFSESAQHNPLAWDYIRPILRENGGWAIFNGTPRGKNWFYKLINDNRENPEWLIDIKGVNETQALTAKDIEDERRSGMREVMIRQEYFCDFTVGLQGSIYADCVEQARAEGRVHSGMLYDCSLPVFTTWDIGSPANTAIWFWQLLHTGELRAVDFMSGEKLRTQERIAALRAKGYSYLCHLLPHDADALQKGGLNYSQELRNAGLTDVRVIPRCADVWVGINKMLELFPRISFQAPQTERGLDALTQYHTKEDKTGSYVTDAIVHDWTSHPADAFRMCGEAILHGMVKAQGLVKLDPERRRRNRGGTMSVCGYKIR
jgi:phage terminase large subunit